MGYSNYIATATKELAVGQFTLELPFLYKDMIIKVIHLYG